MEKIEILASQKNLQSFIYQNMRDIFEGDENTHSMEDIGNDEKNARTVDYMNNADGDIYSH